LFAPARQGPRPSTIQDNSLLLRSLVEVTRIASSICLPVCVRQSVISGWSNPRIAEGNSAFVTSPAGLVGCEMRGRETAKSPTKSLVFTVEPYR